MKSKLEIKCLCLQPGYADTTMNQATQKKNCQISITLKKIPELKMSDPKTSFNHPHDFKSGATPPPLWE